MAIPVIDTRTSEQSWLTGRPQEWQVYATNTPTSWSATGLPSGISISASTGLISGTPTARGVALASIIATNGDGDSVALLVPFSVRGVEAVSQDAADQLSLMIDFDLTTNEISIPGIDPPAAIPVEELAQENATTRIKRELMRVKSGESYPILVGFKRSGVLQDIGVNSIELSARENEPDQSYEITQDSNSVTKVGSGESTRFRTNLSIPEDLLEGVFSNFEDDNGTQAGLLAEISTSIVSTVYDWTTEEKTASFTGFKGNDSQVDTFVFTGLPQATTGPATYTAVCELDFDPSGAFNQDLQFPVSFDAEWNGSSFDVSNVATTTSATGVETDTDSHWLATLEVTSITGTSSGVNIELTTTSSSFGTDVGVALTIASGISNDTINTGSGTSTGSFDIDANASLTLSAGDTASDIKTAFNDAYEAWEPTVTELVKSVIMDNSRNRIILNMGSSSDATFIDDLHAAATGGSPTRFNIDLINDIDVNDGDHKVELSGDPQDDEVTRSSDTFILTAERSINRD